MLRIKLLIHKEKKRKDVTNEFPDITDEDIYKSRIIEEYWERYKKFYNYLIKKGINNDNLTSENPTYNPYHRELIKIKKFFTQI